MITLFKYHKTGDMKYLRELLESNSLYMAPRKKMNDMFDCFFTYSDSYIANEMVGQNFHELKEGRELFNDFLHISMYAFINPGITCFSESNDNDILWAYYTDSSKGICMEFDFNNEDSEFLNALQKVTYSNECTIDTKDDLEILPFRKKEIFSSEKEWRIVFNQGNQRCSFSKNSLKNIYIGARCRKEHVLELMSLVEIHGYSTDFYRMEFGRKHNRIIFLKTNKKEIEEIWENVY